MTVGGKIKCKFNGMIFGKNGMLIEIACVIKMTMIRGCVCEPESGKNMIKWIWIS